MQTKLLSASLVLVAACVAPAPEEPLAQTARTFAATLGDATARADVQARVASAGGHEIPLGTLVMLPNVEVEDVLVVAPALDPALFDGAPLVGYVADTARAEVTFFDAKGSETIVPVGEAPSEPFIVLRPHELASMNPTVPAHEPSELLLNLFVREIRLSEDHEALGDAEIKTLCGPTNEDRTPLPSVDHANKHYRLWDRRIHSIDTRVSQLCVVYEDDGYDPTFLGWFEAPSLGWFGFEPWDFSNTDHDTCKYIAIKHGELWLSRSRGYDQCPSLNSIGVHCPERCQ